ncbi:MAG: metallophosphoesterase [Candidatus Woesearchaeota archaeon]|nr:metallophosphoesterase [Candidatus Woesearchaeota archaeon]
MNRILMFVLLGAAFLILYAGINFYVFLRMSNLLGIKRNIYFYLIMAFLALSFIISMLIETRFYNIFTRTYYVISATWLGVMFFLACSLIIFEIINLIFKVDKFTAGMVIVVFVALLSIYSLVNASFITVKTIEIPVNNLDKDLKIVQLSDIHMGTIRTNNFLTNVVDTTNNINPDLVFITGDLVDGSAPLSNGMFDGINNIKAPVYFITGNHETYENLSRVFEILKSTKARVLRNEIVYAKGLQIIGVDYSMESNYLYKILPNLKINKNKPTILLYHIPTKVEPLANYSINLQLSGHTHDGQIYPFTIFSRMANAYVRGLHNYKDSYVYVSQGTGTWGPPMRFGCNNEITIVELKKK